MKYKMKASEIVKITEKTAPPYLAEDWDNVGILCGSADKDVRKALLTLDINENTVAEAAANGCDMIISHHPLFINGIKRINTDTAEGRMIKTLMQNDITAFAAHTNMDKAKGGINDKLASMFGLKDTEVLVPMDGYPGCGLGRYGKLKAPVSFAELAEMTKKTLHTPVRICGDKNADVLTIAVGSGGCSDLIPTARAKGCDVMITADMKYHTSIDAVLAGISVIDAGHYPTEIIVMDIFEQILKDTGIELIKSKNKDIFQFV